jgi:hypothetical protein
MKDQALQSHHSVSEYFHEVVSEALRNQGVETSAHAEFYLVNLLAEYSHAPLCDQPLTLLLAEAREAPPEVRIRKLRTVGDHSLYVTGFFAESLSARSIDSEYYIALGGTAYASLSQSCSTQPFSQVYGELARKFERLVEVLAEVAAETKLASSAGVLHLYERYMRTGAGWVARRLGGVGILPGRGGSGGSA